MATTATYRDVSQLKDQDPVDFLFQIDKLYVPESALTPKHIARYYERLAVRVPVDKLYARSHDNPQGLQSLHELLRHEPSNYGEKWLRMGAFPEVIQAALPSQTPYQMQYLVLVPFIHPKWKDTPREEGVDSWGMKHMYLAPIESEALLVGKNGWPYMVKAIWATKEKAYGSGTPEHDEVHMFNLTHLSVRKITWDDSELLRRIEDTNSGWKDFYVVNARVQMAIRGTLNIMDERVRVLKGVASDLEFAQDHVYSGR